MTPTIRGEGLWHLSVASAAQEPLSAVRGAADLDVLRVDVPAALPGGLARFDGASGNHCDGAEAQRGVYDLTKPSLLLPGSSQWYLRPLDPDTLSP